ncbi:unnamed protein product [Protopolystoma xenopodis]|uniref:Uncharacterized protein n=1 Tax=Protopolystoma xenopodis TaxID=117903 RepID=A0A448WXL8_9PLAT|nr:unnamed protein product [Protopolystoma xenopodis]
MPLTNIVRPGRVDPSPVTSTSSLRPGVSAHSSQSEFVNSFFPLDKKKQNKKQFTFARQFYARMSMDYRAAGSYR